MTSDWNEIKRLAADFQRAQLTSTLQTLSEGNCVEIMCQILEQELTDVVFANDGKEYITVKHLENEILNELYVNMGRVNLTEVSTSLNVDLSKVASIASDIAGRNSGIYFILGQLMEEDYIKRMAQEINAELSHRGQINVSDLSARFDLPSDFLQQNVMEKYLGTIIQGRQDSTIPSVFFTQIFLQRCKVKVKGTLVAITRPTNVASIVQQVSFPEKVLHTILDETELYGMVTTKFSNALYIPHVYAKMQSDWIRSFFEQNSFLEYETLLKLGINDPKQFIKQQFSDENMVFLKKCAVSSRIADLLLSVLLECKINCSFVDVFTILPSNMMGDDIQDLLQTVLVSNNEANNFLLLRNVVFSNNCITKIIQPCYDLARSKAKEAIEKQLIFSSENKFCGHECLDQHKTRKRDDLRKQMVSDTEGGGSQGHSKMKTTKKKRDYKIDNREENTSHKRPTNKALELVKTEDIEEILVKKLTDEGIGHLTGEIAKIYLKEINQAANQAAQELFEAMPKMNIKLKRASLMEKLTTLLTDIRLYDKGLKFFSVDVQLKMAKYLLKTLGNDVSNLLHVYLAMEFNLNIPTTSNLNVEQRYQIARELDDEYKSALIELNMALEKTVDEFILASECALNVCNMMLKKKERKQDHTLIIQHRENLCLQLSGTDNYASTLHLASLILFTKITGCILHVSGRFVSHILTFIKPSLSSTQNDLLTQYHGFVLQLLQTKEASTENDVLFKELSLLQTKVKELALHYEKE